MSVVVAVKENGVVYMGADTQTSSGFRKVNYLNENEFKILKFSNGILVGICGVVASEQCLLAEPTLFSLEDGNRLTKKHIVNKIIPKIIEILAKNGCLDKDDGTMDISIILAYKDSIYRIKRDFTVFGVEKYAAIGAGKSYALYSLINDGKTVQERILSALHISSKTVDSVSAPYILINTKDLKFEVIDDCGNQR